MVLVLLCRENEARMGHRELLATREIREKMAYKDSMVYPVKL